MKTNIQNSDEMLHSFDLKTISGLATNTEEVINNVDFEIKEGIRVSKVEEGWVMRINERESRLGEIPSLRFRKRSINYHSFILTTLFHVLDFLGDDEIRELVGEGDSSSVALEVEDDGQLPPEKVYSIVCRISGTRFNLDGSDNVWKVFA